MSENVLTIENATMQFGGVVAVANLHLKVDKDPIVSLIGPNGAGKTTAFNVVTGVYAPTKGCLLYTSPLRVFLVLSGKVLRNNRGGNSYESIHFAS